MKIAICDDEIEFCQKINDALNKVISDDDIVKCFDSGINLLNSMNEEKYDIVYLDIEMPGIYGLEVAERLQKINAGTLIIFVSSYNCYISKAFKINAFQFLIKEYADESEIVSEYNRAKERYRLEHYLYTIKKKDTVEKIEIKMIVYIESRHRHLYAITVDGNKHEFRGKIINEEKKLKMFNFVRIHESILVNMAYIRRIESSSLKLKYQEDNYIPISRRYKENLMNEFNLYISGCSI